jgi:lysophospholipase L1-like esterase
MEDVVTGRRDPALELVRGRDLVDENQLGDGIHPNDDGHRVMAAVLGSAVRELVGAKVG